MAKVYYSLYDRMLSIDNLRKGFFKVKSTKGAAGIDGHTISDFAEDLSKVIDDLNPLLRCFSNYFRIANCKGLFVELSQWIRRRPRCKQMALWKKPGRLHRRLRQLGYQGDFNKIGMHSWRNSRSPLASYALPNKYFDDLGLFDLGSVQTGMPVSWK